MVTVGTYLNFPVNTEKAFNFYKSVFSGEFDDEIRRFKNIPAMPDMPPIADVDKNLVLHIALPIVSGHILMGIDDPESMGYKVIFGNNVCISLHLDTRKETERLFKVFSEGGKVE